MKKILFLGLLLLSLSGLANAMQRESDWRRPQHRIEKMVEPGMTIYLDHETHASASYAPDINKYSGTAGSLSSSLGLPHGGLNQEQLSRVYQYLKNEYDRPREHNLFY